MRNFRYIALLSVFAILSCDSDDDGFYNTKYIDASGLVSLEPLADYDIGSVLFVQATVPQLLAESGYGEPLDVRQSTGNAPSFDFAYTLERETSPEVWEVVDVSANFVEELGDSQTGSYVRGILEYDAADSQYEYRGGITLSQTGNYRLSYGFNSSAPNKVDLRSNSTGNNVTLHIFTTTNSINEQGYYFFTVD